MVWPLRCAHFFPARTTLLKQYNTNYFFGLDKPILNEAIFPSDSGGSDLYSRFRLTSFMLFLCSDCKGEERTGREPGTQLLQSNSSSLTYSEGEITVLVRFVSQCYIESTPQVAQAVQFVLSGLQCGECPDPSFPCSTAMPLVKLFLLLLFLLPCEH